jgi:MFS family permease
MDEFDVRLAKKSGKGPSGRSFFYGWVIVGGGFAVLLVTYGAQFSFSVFFPHLLDEFGWQRKDLSGAFSLYTIIYSGVSALVGMITDVKGPGKMVFAGGVLLFLGLGLMSQVHQLWHVYLCLSVIAGVGMSTVFVTINSTIIKWFVRRRGLAVGIALCGNGVGIMLIPYLASILIPLLGWRFTYVCLGALVLLVMAWASRVMIALPEKIGLRPDGDPAEVVNGCSCSLPVKFPTRLEASSSPVFWLLALIFCANSFSLFFPFVHFTAFSLDSGYGERAAVAALSLIGVANMGGRLFGGALTSKMGSKGALVAALALQAISWPFLLVKLKAWGFTPYAVLFGVSYGWRVAILPIIVAEYFGRNVAGSILGMLFCLEGFSAASGVFLAGYLFDVARSYHSWFLIAAVGNALGLSLVIFLKSPTLLAEKLSSS